VNDRNEVRPTVLVVDDSELACEAVRHALGETHYEVVALNSPFGFIKTVRESRPSLILVDVGLGSVNGTKLVHLGREHAPAGCPIVLYSSREKELLERDVLASGADGYITKSTTGNELSTRVRHWIKQPRTRR
jgi:PleD family two-component response regulator